MGPDTLIERGNLKYRDTLPWALQKQVTIYISYDVDLQRDVPLRDGVDNAVHLWGQTPKNPFWVHE